MCQGLINTFHLELQPEERVDTHVVAHRDALGELLNGTQELLQYRPPSDFVPAQLQGVTVLSGSFNPLHDGHRDLLATATAHTGQPGIFELSVINVDKPALPYSVIQRRAAQFATSGTLVISRAPRFLDKARLMPQSTFVLGYDTVIRLLDPKYYPDGDVAETLRQLATHEVRFIVAGRVDKHGQFRLFDTTSVPSTWRHLFLALDEVTFRRDVSSTSIRAQQVT
jgi:nicotinic acid mononucleotide adenylyltransferase